MTTHKPFTNPTPMTNYERIKTIIQNGFMAEVKKWVLYQVCSSITTEWEVIHSGWCNSILECMDYMCRGVSIAAGMDCYKMDYIRPIWIKPPVLKVGDMVEILEVAKECGDYEKWDEDKKEMVW